MTDQETPRSGFAAYRGYLTRPPGPRWQSLFGIGLSLLMYLAVAGMLRTDRPDAGDLTGLGSNAPALVPLWVALLATASLLGSTAELVPARRMGAMVGLRLLATAVSVVAIAVVVAVMWGTAS